MEEQAPCPTPETARERQLAQAANKLGADIWVFLSQRNVDTAVGLIALANVMGQMAAGAADFGKSGPLLASLFKQADMVRAARCFNESLDHAGLSALKPGQRS